MRLGVASRYGHANNSFVITALWLVAAAGQVVPWLRVQVADSEARRAFPPYQYDTIKYVLAHAGDVSVQADSASHVTRSEVIGVAVTAALAGGSVTRAMAILGRHGLQRRTWLLAQLFDLPRQSPLGLLALAEKLSRERIEISADFDLMASWLRDVAIARHCPEKMMHADLRQSFHDAAGGMHDAAIGEAMGALQEAVRRIRANANPRLTLEALFIQLAACFRPAG